MQETFRKIAAQISRLVGSVWAFMLAFVLIFTWALTGPVFNFSNTWQLVINTTTTIVTFLMVFVIQNTQNRDSKAIHLKLDELIKAVKGASMKMLDIENLPDAELEEMLEDFRRRNEKYKLELERRKSMPSSKTT